jgi:very-short-patch-repair endonuclease
MKLHNRRHLKSLRRALRVQFTPAEARLWKYLQGGQLEGRKFRRQHSIGAYIMDFYCPAERLVIELDGSAHDGEDAWRRDEARTAYLEKMGIQVVRFENRQVMENLEGVLAVIHERFK